MDWQHDEDDYEIPPPARKSNDMNDLLNELVNLKIERARLEARVKQIIDRTKEMQPQLRHYFETNPDWQAITINGHTVKMEHEYWAKAKTGKEEGCEALKRAGLGQFVSETFNLNTISAYVRELAAQQQQAAPAGSPVVLPPDLADVFDVVETDVVYAKKAQRAKRKTVNEESETESEEAIPWNEEQVNSLTEN